MEFQNRPFFPELHNAVFEKGSYNQFEQVQVDSVGALDTMFQTDVRYDSPFKLDQETTQLNLFGLVEASIMPMNVSMTNLAEWLARFKTKELKFHSSWYERIITS